MGPATGGGARVTAPAICNGSCTGWTLYWKPGALDRTTSGRLGSALATSRASTASSSTGMPELAAPSSVGSSEPATVASTRSIWSQSRVRKPLRMVSG